MISNLFATQRRKTSLAVVAASTRTLSAGWTGRSVFPLPLVVMQSSNSQNSSDQRYDRFVAAPGARSIPPGALASYLQAQQSWRKAQAGTRHTEVSSSNQTQSSILSGSASANSTSSCSCSTSDRHLEAHGLPALGCRTVARLFQRRHDLMLRHRHQRQAAKRRKLSSTAPEAPAGLLALPEDVLVRVAKRTNFLLFAISCFAVTKKCLPCSCTSCTTWSMKISNHYSKYVRNFAAW